MWWTAGKMLSVMATAVETTKRHLARAERETAQQRLRDVLDAMAEGFALLRPDFNLLDVNAETLRLDSRPAVQLIGRSHCEAYPESKASPIGDLLRRVMRERVPESLEHWYTLPDGRERWLDAHAYSTPGGGLAAFRREVTDSEGADDALRRSRERQTFLLTLPDALQAEPDAEAVADRALRMLCDALETGPLLYRLLSVGRRLRR